MVACGLGVVLCRVRAFRRLSGHLAGGYAQDELAAGHHLSTLFHEDAVVGDCVGWLIGLRHRSRQEMPEDGPQPGSAARLLDIVLNLLSDGLLPDGLRVNGVSADGLWVSAGDGHSFPLRELGDGYRTVAALVLDVTRQRHAAYGQLKAHEDDSGRVVILQPDVVLIDEVDAHLHVTWQQQIGDVLRDHFPNVQFIVTSHSPYRLSGRRRVCADPSAGSG
ncbi:hypothetical protein EJ357_47310 [Streptomyces cyaneochromogenes]|uniref:ATPase AAA-type core domain-containing protein n=1 Tax=Streptomyces cyaneochromogenes TaxID=2496836 RepID=A0A3Q9F0N6_9ACTN|nr:AAA family ATPase [Streptomyces cyaneochromogenes]AZQ40058.1 hypothetical protein EJ357_47310 [Streptomyces cyaneochromogenes]